MVFNCTQDICSSFNITFVWSAQLVPGGCGEGDTQVGTTCRVRLWLPEGGIFRAEARSSRLPLQVASVLTVRSKGHGLPSPGH